MKIRFHGVLAVITMSSLLALAAWGLVLAQDVTNVPPGTLLEAMDLDLCPNFLWEQSSADAEPTETTPDGSAERSVLVFDLSAMRRSDLMALMVFESRASVEARLRDIPLVALDSLTSDDDSGATLYGWLVVYFDADGQPFCRSTAYPALAGQDSTIEIVSMQGFIAQMVSRTKLSPSRYQPADACTFDTPDFCDAIFIGDGTDERMEGTNGADLMDGGAGNDTLIGNAGNDAMRGGEGGDFMDGGDGNDVIIGDGGNDVIHGGDGDDVIRAGDGDDVVTGDGGLDTLSGDNGVDTVHQ